VNATPLDPSNAKVLRQPLVSVFSQLSLVRQNFRDTSEKRGKNHNCVFKRRKNQTMAQKRKQSATTNSPAPTSQVNNEANTSYGEPLTRRSSRANRF
jgi:hypothetical protein